VGVYWLAAETKKADLESALWTDESEREREAKAGALL